MRGAVVCPERLAIAGLSRYISLMTEQEIALLTPRERLDLIRDLWDSLSPDDVKLTPAQVDEIDRRMQSFDEDARTSTPWRQRSS